MKTVKINYASVGEDFDKKQNLIYDLLVNNGYRVEISEDPDYLICGVMHEDPYQYCGSRAVRILYSGENYIPDFNLIDYSICPYPIAFGDRNFQLPACVWPREHWLGIAHKATRGGTAEFVKNKQYFANFISGHESEYNLRGDFFKQLCQYKRVESPGSYLNNMPGGETVDWLNSSKTAFQSKCKFTLCFESTNHYGFVTEKIMDAFYAGTIPVYYGSETVKEIFNPEAFIHVGDYDSFDAAIQRIIELDQDDGKYLEMLNRPALVDPEYPEKLEQALNAYIRHIFDQPLEQAYRRSRVYAPKIVDDYIARCVDSEDLTMAELLRRVGRKVADKLGRR